MTQLTILLIKGLQSALFAEKQLVSALPKMARAPYSPKLKEGFAKHLLQTQTHVQRLENIFLLLETSAAETPRPAVLGQIKVGDENISKAFAKDPLTSDLTLIAAAQKVDHYEIPTSGNLRGLARQAGHIEVDSLLAHTLGEEYP